jgi:hypothetical protein
MCYVWTAANSLEWQRDGLCAIPANYHLRESFFADDPDDLHPAKNLCFQCPVRQQCLQWALENKQIWGTWGGRDENEIRRTLSVNVDGDEVKKSRPPACPYCSARTARLHVTTEDIAGGGRWTTAKVVNCLDCGFAWRSRTSANAVNSYHNARTRKP